MKRKTFFTICSLILAICITASACAPATVPPTDEKTCKVVLSESSYYTCSENIRTVSRGSDAEFTLEIISGYTFKDASYNDYSVNIGSPDSGTRTRTVHLTLNHVRYSSFVEVEVQPEPIYSVTIASSDAFRCDTPEQFVLEGEDAVFTLFFQEDYTFASIDYSGGYHVTGIDSDINYDRERRVVLTVENVTEDANITVTERDALPPTTDGPIDLQQKPGYAVIGYVLNGGWFLSEDNSGSYYTINYPLFHFPRPNTSLGTDMISRYGYVLTGWNTKPDGSGDHVGLGSRANVTYNETLVLYAEWAEWTDVSSFDFVVIDTEDIPELYEERADKLQKLTELAESASSSDRSAVITGYHGTGAETLVLPERLGGYPVAVVAGSTVKNDNKIKTVVFPVSMKYVMENAFLSCERLTEIYLYDNMAYVDGLAFGERNEANPCMGEHIETLHINAKKMPVYGTNESAQLANKIEMLIKYEKETKAIVFGSCSIWYSVHAENFGDAIGRPGFNMGVEGETCTLVQLDIIRQYMQEGDILIYMCDIGSPNLLGYDVSYDARTYRMFEFNYDLLATVNLQRYTNTIPALNEYFITKDLAISQGKTGSYDDHLIYISENGDMKDMWDEPSHNGFYNFISKQTLEEKGSLEKTKAILQEFADMKIDIYYGFGLISEVCIQNTNGADKIVEEVNEYFIEQFRELQMPAKMLGNLYTSILPDKYFYDMPYRLNAYGREYFTEKLVEYFRSVLD